VALPLAAGAGFIAGRASKEYALRYAKLPKFIARRLRRRLAKKLIKKAGKEAAAAAAKGLITGAGVYGGYRVAKRLAERRQYALSSGIWEGLPYVRKKGPIASLIPMPKYLERVLDPEAQKCYSLKKKDILKVLGIIAPSAVAGAAGGYLAGRRRERLRIGRKILREAGIDLPEGALGQQPRFGRTILESLIGEEE